MPRSLGAQDKELDKLSYQGACMRMLRGHKMKAALGISVLIVCLVFFLSRHANATASKGTKGPKVTDKVGSSKQLYSTGDARQSPVLGRKISGTGTKRGEAPGTLKRS